ncbi:RNase E specificity factor CsrD [Thaumasiovibrio subtropicus]|uniref:RNase E specificity factor CsrD n=1 Tax=Thaumasiovibrio subtropicus TaxID=1891207 RepID=UPI000B34C1D8|nr:RNase E specificity factor CsrD [Thaumasiovibrio subtropicus]
MRKASGMKLSNRLVAFVTVVVFAAILVLFIGGSMSFRYLADTAVKNYFDGMVQVIDEELSDPDGVRNIQDWLPKMLKAGDIIEFDISNSAGSVFHYEQIKFTASTTERHRLYYDLTLNPELRVSITSVPAFTYTSYSLGAMSAITLAIAIIGIGVIFGVQWLKKQLHGSEVLETRGRMILAGRMDEYSQGDEAEWPATASLALDQVIAELKDARQERSRFDTFIRTHTFLDQLTGAANRVLYDSRLNSLLNESDNTGVVVLLQIADYDELISDNGEQVADEFIKDIALVIGNFMQRFPDAVFSRYYDAEFALMLANPVESEVSGFINQLLKALEKLDPPAPLDVDDWCHIGVSYFASGEPRGRVMDEADRALKSAQLQGTNSWFAFRKESQLDEGRGNVRWRTLFDRIFDGEGPVIYQQPVMTHDETVHRELLARIRDENGVLIKASRFVPVMKEVGYITKLDRFMLEKTLSMLPSSEGTLAVNISVTSLSQRDFYRWFSQSVMQCPREQRSKLLIEISEASAVASLDALRPVSKLINSLGSGLVVDHAGRSIVSMHYIKELEPKYLKLHRSLVKDIDQRPENQLFIRSMLGSCADTSTKIVAVGVESKKEWQKLRTLGVEMGQGRLFGAELRHRQ